MKNAAELISHVRQQQPRLSQIEIETALHRRARRRPPNPNGAPDEFIFSVSFYQAPPRHSAAAATSTATPQPACMAPPRVRSLSRYTRTHNHERT